MRLFNLGINNVKHNFKNYISYFISILTSVFILMIFYSIYYNNHIQSFSLSRIKVVIIFEMAAFIVIIFSAIFIWYANSFFIKNKKKEVALYSLLGMRKKEIGLLMFFENIFIGLVALIVAVPLGAFTSRFFLKLLTVCMKSDTPIEYKLDIRSIIMTALVFMVIFLLNSIKAYRIIYKYKLIELMYASHEGEKQPKFSKILALLSIIMLGGGYFIALTMDLSSGGSQLMYKAIIIMTFVIVGTYILFNNLIIYMLKLFKNNKKVYYKGENLIGVSQIIYRIKGNCNLLATISVISAVAITALCFTFSFNMVLDEIIPNGTPFSIIYQGGNKELDKKVDYIINNYEENKVTYKTEIVMINGKGLTEKYKGPYGKDLQAPFDMFVISKSDYMDIIKNSSYNKGSDISERATDIKVDKENQCFFIEVSNLGSGRGRLVGDKLSATIGEESYKLDISDSDIKGVLGSKFQKVTVVVPDIFYNNLLDSNKNNLTILRGYNFENPLKIESIVTDINKIMPKDRNFDSYYDVYILLHSLYGSFIFIGMFLGILFVVSTGSILYYKQLMEASDDKNRYHILSKIGLSKKETLKIIIKQIGFIFLIPLLFGILHSTVALEVYIKYVSNGGGSSKYLIGCIGAMMGIYILVYLCYYLLSIKSYMKIIKNSAT